jgi:hypothetical protein
MNCDKYISSIIILLVLITIITYFGFNIIKNLHSENININKILLEASKIKPIEKPNNINIDLNSNYNPMKKFNHGDMQNKLNVLYNAFVPPVKLDGLSKLTSINTRPIDDYQLLGILTGKDAVFNLFGRQIYKGSNVFDYYIVGSINNTQIKIPLTNTKELENNQDIIIPQLDNKSFKIFLYEYNKYNYTPELENHEYN